MTVEFGTKVRGDISERRLRQGLTATQAERNYSQFRLHCRMLVVCGLVTLLAVGSMTWPTGAPDEVCDSVLMKPTFHVDNYNATGVNNKNQYSLTAEPVPGSNGKVEVTLKGNSFLGFVVRATTPGEENLGNFIAEESNVKFKTLSCKNVTDVAVTHTNPSSKSSITLMWQDFNNGNYVFQATTLQSLNNYVMNIF
ncbi:putative ferric-chelate reductase 1 homolog isoform X2 [Portunus trituberculatus]|uniref:putative ferric-chelate reductase 1 homolog isoform X2 n=1 Tax=Portunus trituberculatus TaxID=210409 RepID=UPI001E1CF0CA|nr:putative ferric-chelate reductase 1 homolog isoform X2 [Portunus trituberculatus]